MKLDPLGKLRDKIDDVDQQLVDLLAQRLALVAEVG
ncbi:3-deoxy-7-phosphoheptulonate synthase, partial [Moritella sp. PE36]